MKDELVSFETAKLALTAGIIFRKVFRFNYSAYTEAGELVNSDVLKTWVQANIPSQSLLQRWLREEHEKVVYVIPVMNSDNTTKYYAYQINGVDCCVGLHNANRFLTWEQALEKGLLETLKLLIKEQK